MELEAVHEMKGSPLRMKACSGRECRKRRIDIEPIGDDLVMQPEGESCEVNRKIVHNKLQDQKWFNPIPGCYGRRRSQEGGWWATKKNVVKESKGWWEKRVAHR